MWKKYGLILDPKKYPFLGTHAALPIADKIYDDKYRIYFTSRDKNNHSQVFFIEVNLHNLKQIDKISSKPILTPGKLGSFDENGVMASSLITYNKKKLLYYIGWNRRINIPYHNSIGLAISTDNGKTFHRYSDGPIIERNVMEPYFSASCYVIKENRVWKMWYLSNIEWRKINHEIRPKYHIKYAESSDGISWERKGIVAIDFKDKNEWAISRPCVLKENSKYKMWYSYRGKINYRIGYAESNDGISWERKDRQVGITPSRTGWDSSMIEYPFVIKNKNRMYMFYNGNDFGKTGFGYATMEQKS